MAKDTALKDSPRKDTPPKAPIALDAGFNATLAAGPVLEAAVPPSRRRGGFGAGTVAIEQPAAPVRRQAAAGTEPIRLDASAQKLARSSERFETHGNAALAPADPAPEAAPQGENAPLSIEEEIERAFLEGGPKLVPPAPANDAESRQHAARMRERERVGAAASERQKRNERWSNTARGRAEPPPTFDPRTPAERRRAERTAAEEARKFGNGTSPADRRERAAYRFAVAAAFGVVALLCGGIGAYIWYQAPHMTGAIAPAPTRQVPGPQTMAAIPSPRPPVQTDTVPDAPPIEKTVKVAVITLSPVDLAVQDARELAAMGDMLGVRQVLEPYRTGGDGRVLFALAETYDPSVNRNAGQVDLKQAQQLYEAAGRAGAEGVAERVAKLQPPAN